MKRRLALVVLLLPGLALADARVEARKRFRQGMALIRDGRFEEGIDQLLEAYAIKPHPNVLYNVAKAYESLEKPVQALAYYRGYLDTDPPDAAEVKRAIARLEPQVPKSKAPPREVEPAPPVKPAEPSRPAVDDATVRRLAQTVERLESAVQRLEERAAAVAEKPRDEARAAPGVGGDGAALLGPDEAGVVPYEETVVTASRRAQSTLEAPNAITIITADEIRLSGAHSLPELLRRVPGAEVVAMGVSSANVSFRGFNQRIANKVLLLIDGRPEYQDFLGLTLWPSLTIELSEIERIEIVRGPGSALYGANAMLGVINVITRTPGTGAAAELSGYAGNAGTAGGSLVASGGKTIRFRASVGYGQEQKWSRDFADDRPDFAPQLKDTWLGYRSVHGNLVATYAFNRDFSVTVSGGANRLFTEVYPIGILRNFYLDGVNGYAKAEAGLGPLKVKFFWNNLSANAGPQYWPIGARSISTYVEANVFDLEAVFQREFQLLGRHRITIGASGRLKRLKWSYLGALKQELHGAVFAQEEWRPINPITLTLSYRLDEHPLLDNGKPGYAHSPRVSLVATPFEGHAFRASFATAFREPTFLESYTDLAIPLPGVNGASVLTHGSTTLKPERLLSFELGYRGESARFGLAWDLALYQNYVNDLVVLSAVNPLPPEQSYDPATASYLLGRSVFQNDPVGYVARGAELGFTWSATAGLDLRLSASLQQVAVNGPQTGPCGPCSQAPVGKVFAGVSYRTPVGLDLELDASFASSTTWIEREPDAADPTRIANISNSLPAYVVFNARAGYRFFDDRLQVAVVGSQLGPSHQEHPFGNLISRRVFATLTVRP
ncbi:MAG: TonB-dependent receptor [Archangiaceae bacterium]|nr:TonB-dependent receptor [Archangiaceae bacterium]